MLRLLLLSLIYLTVPGILAAGNKSDSSAVIKGTSTGSTSLVSSTAAVASGSNGTLVQGDSQCPGTQLMCVTATVDGSTITYELQSTGSQPLGWMAVGFGSQMPDTPMVILWPNADGSITLSQRQASGHVMPTPVLSPPRVATLAASLSTPSGAQPKLVFTIPGTVSMSQSLIWAYGLIRPDPVPDAMLLQHVDSGAITLDLTKTISRGSATLPSGYLPPLASYQKLIVAHAIIASFGFLFLLPAGVLLARYTRTLSSRWFTGHWIMQAGVGGVVCIVGLALGFVVDNQLGGNLGTEHEKVGKTLLTLYLVQCSLGSFIHYVKIPWRFGRPPQNYLHAILGLVIIVLALYQVRLGYREEWPATGRGTLGHGVDIVWTVWVVLLSVLYVGGLAFLPRQWRQESGSRAKLPEEHQLAGYEDDSREDKFKSSPQQ